MARTTHIFLIGGDTPIFLHPFFPGSEVFSDTAGLDLVGRYGNGDEPAALQSMRSSLYSAVEKGARGHVLGLGFYSRLGLCALTFVFVYLFFSIVVRDPLPLVDEVLIAGCATAAVWFAMERRNLTHPRHSEALASMRGILDAVYFSESRVVFLLESWRDKALALGAAAYYDAPGTEVPQLSSEEKTEAQDLCAYLAQRYKSKSQVAALWSAITMGKPVGRPLDAVFKHLPRAEAALALAYMKLLVALKDGRL